MSLDSQTRGGCHPTCTGADDDHPSHGSSVGLNQCAHHSAAATAIPGRAKIHPHRAAAATTESL